MLPSLISCTGDPIAYISRKKSYPIDTKQSCIPNLMAAFGVTIVIYYKYYLIYRAETVDILLLHCLYAECLDFMFSMK